MTNSFNLFLLLSKKGEINDLEQAGVQSPAGMFTSRNRISLLFIFIPSRFKNTLKNHVRSCLGRLCLHSLQHLTTFLSLFSTTLSPSSLWTERRHVTISNREIESKQMIVDDANMASHTSGLSETIIRDINFSRLQQLMKMISAKFFMLY